MSVATLEKMCFAMFYSHIDFEEIFDDADHWDERIEKICIRYNVPEIIAQNVVKTYIGVDEACFYNCDTCSRYTFSRDITYVYWKWKPYHQLKDKKISQLDQDDQNEEAWNRLIETNEHPLVDVMDTSSHCATYLFLFGEIEFGRLAEYFIHEQCKYVGNHVPVYEKDLFGRFFCYRCIDKISCYRKEIESKKSLKK